MDNTPSISVVMPTYNTPLAFLKEAINSILKQTFRDFEFIILDDCSTDDSVAYLHSLTDERIRIIRNVENLGITKTLNVGLRAARGKYIARMDSDDVSLPERFEKQFAYMESHPNVVMCGSRIEKIGVESGYGVSAIQDMELYRTRMVFCYPGPMHPTIFLRRETMEKNQIFYDESLIYTQDYGLYADIVRYGDVYFSPEVLLRYRTHSGQVSTTKRETQIRCAKAVQRKLLRQLLDDLTEDELDMHYKYSSGYLPDITIDPEIEAWYRKLEAANLEKGIYDPAKFRQSIVFVKRRLLLHSFPRLSLAGKAKLCFRYLPAVDALKLLIKQR